MTAPTRTWSNPLSFRVEPHGIAVDKTNNIVYVSTDMSSFTLAYTNTGGLFAGILDAKDNIWISGGSNVLLGSVPPQTTKQLYVGYNGQWKPVTAIYCNHNGSWALTSSIYGSSGGTWK